MATSLYVILLEQYLSLFDESFLDTKKRSSDDNSVHPESRETGESFSAIYSFPLVFLCYEIL